MSKVTISDFILAISDLIEAQSKELQKEWGEFFEKQRRGIKNTFASLSLIIVFAFLLLFGFLAFAFATYKLLAIFMPDFAAMYIISIFFFVVAFIIFKSTKNE
jgi:uncharacterized membrane protein